MRRAALAVAALLLAACGGQGGNDLASNASEDNAAAADAAGTEGVGAANAAFQPGQWETTTEVIRMDRADSPNLPPGMEPGTAVRIPPQSTLTFCLAAAQAAPPSADFLTGSGETGLCRTQELRMANGQIGGTVLCDARGAQIRAMFDGRYTPTSYAMNNRVLTVANGVTMNMETRTTARRTGNCPAG